MSNHDVQRLSYASPPRWAAQQSSHRAPSKSPNIRDRTPIRHNRPDFARHRSSSRTEALYAYAEEQAQPVQFDTDALKAMGLEVIPGEIITYDQHVIRHDTLKVASLLVDLLQQKK